MQRLLPCSHQSRVTGMLRGVLLAAERHDGLLLRVEGYCYRCDYELDACSLATVQRAIGQELAVTVQARGYRPAAGSDGAGGKELWLAARRLRGEVPVNGYMEVLGLVASAGPDAFIMQVRRRHGEREQRFNLSIRGEFTGDVGQFILAECQLADGALHLNAWEPVPINVRRLRALQAAISCEEGRSLYEQGRLDTAGAAFRQALAVDPTLPQVHFRLGLVYDDLGDLEEAIQHYRQEVDGHPRLAAKAWFNIGVACQRLGRGAQAVDAYMRAGRLGLWPKINEGFRFDG